MNIKKLIKRIEHTAPLRGASSWDKSGVQIAGRLEQTEKIALMLDPLPPLIAEALSWEAGFILCHHPLSLDPRFLDCISPYHEIVRQVISKDAWLYAAHTSLDAQPAGPASWFVRELGIQRIRPLEPTFSAHMHRLLFPLPGSADQLAEKWASLPGVLNKPSFNSGQVAICCEENALQEIMQAIRSDLSDQPHDLFFSIQETPHLAVELGIGQIGTLPRPLPWADFISLVHKLIPRDFLTICGNEPEIVASVACCPGSGASLASAASVLGAQVLITGDIKHHQALDLPLCVVDVGHFSLEEEMTSRFAQLLAIDPELAGLEVRFFPGRDPLRLAVTR